MKAKNFNYKIINFKFFPLFLLSIFSLSLTPGIFSPATVSAASLSGRILLQVQSHGEAWYVNPVDAKRYYMGRPDDAFALMRSFGLGAKDADIGSYQLSSAPSRLSGRILLQVQDKGQAFYVYPLNLELYYLGRPTDAFNVMRSLGLGISNSDLSKIPIGLGSVIPSGSVTTPSTPSPAQTPSAQTPSVQTPSTSGLSYDKVYNFKYKNSSRVLTQTLYKSYYDAYAASPKSYSYSSGSDVSIARNSFYAVFLNLKSGDTSIDEIIYKLKATATAQNWSDDELLEFAMSFVQFIPYDSDKVAGNITNVNPYYPYETLYLDRGVCSDKTFLAVVILRKLGYGAAIFDFPDSNHSSAAVSCPMEYSISNSGYCYIETTNYFPLGVVPKGLSSGVATDDGNNFNNLFDASRLGKIEIYQKTTGKTYYLVSNTVATVNKINDLDKRIEIDSPVISSLESALKIKESAITVMKAEMDAYFSGGQVSKYNAMVPEYNTLIAEYNADLAVYRDKANAFNTNVNLFNQMIRDFYQK